MNGDAEDTGQTLLQGMPEQDTGDQPLVAVAYQQPPPSGEPDLEEFRAQHADELEDPRLLGDLFSLTHNEVGGQGPEARQAFMESVMNRATARGQSLSQTINDRRYYPGISYRPASLSPEDVGRYTDTLKDVIGGSNISNYATGNASGRVGFNGGPRTFSAGGEHFGVEGPDMGWHQRGPAAGGGMAQELQPSSNYAQNQQAAMRASRMTGQPPEQVDTSQLNQILQSQIEGRSRGLMAGQPTAAAVEQAQQTLQDQADQQTTGGGGGGATEQTAMPSNLEGVTTGDMPSPDTRHMKMTPLPDGTMVFDEGSDHEVRFNPQTGMKQWIVRGPGYSRAFIQNGPFATPQSYDTRKYHTNVADGTVVDLGNVDANGQPKVVYQPATGKISADVRSAIIQAGAPLANPDGTPFKNDLEAMKSLQNFQQSQGIPTKSQQHVIDQVNNKINSGRNPYIRPFLQQIGNFQSAMDNINLPSRNGVDDALLIASYYGLERPGYAPTEADLKTFMRSMGMVGQMEVGAKQLTAMKNFIVDKLQGKEPREDASVTLNQGRLIDDSVLPQMKSALERVVEPRYKLYEAGMAPLRHQLVQAGIRNPELYLPDVKPDFMRQQEAAQGLPGGAPAAPAASPAAGPAASSNNAAYQAAQRGLNSPNSKVRALAQRTMETLQRSQETPTPTPTPTP